MVNFTQLCLFPSNVNVHIETPETHRNLRTMKPELKPNLLHFK